MHVECARGKAYLLLFTYNLLHPLQKKERSIVVVRK